MGFRPSSMSLTFPITNSSNPVAEGQDHCSKSQSRFPLVQLRTRHTRWDKFIPADPQPVWDEEAPPLAPVS